MMYPLKNSANPVSYPCTMVARSPFEFFLSFHYFYFPFVFLMAIDNFFFMAFV